MNRIRNEMVDIATDIIKIKNITKEYSNCVPSNQIIDEMGMFLEKQKLTQQETDDPTRPISKRTELVIKLSAKKSPGPDAREFYQVN